MFQRYSSDRAPSRLQRKSRIGPKQAVDRGLLIIVAFEQLSGAGSGGANERRLHVQLLPEVDEVPYPPDSFWIMVCFQYKLLAPSNTLQDSMVI
jgi:hypothetical protein